ncbi:small, acid-soluble spore protein I [Paenibacillus spiritus]|uniref:Small, acid-soluble spore protein I n=1 Tax=Paenibacillus spiritus TaxID=2496557 RepID=A0A5J5GK18_9BACL|nr:MULTISPECIES: small acid-soluble spore protein SspI [Paenibacillus]KAA9008661.1 small, acid-soluble spore protein I [Paenibacillus spiritus]
MSVTLDLRQAVIHKIHGQSQSDLRRMIEGSVDGPEAALPGLGVVFELIWKEIDPPKQATVLAMLEEKVKDIEPGPLTR